MKGRILVTGGTGFIGSHTVVELINAGYAPVIIDSLENSQRFILDRIYEITGVFPAFYEGDCRDEKLMDHIFEKENITGVIHFAAYKAVGESVLQPLKYYSNNISSLVTLLQCMEKWKVSHLVFSSSCTVYGNAKSIPVNENSAVDVPNSPYGNTKIICEEIIHDAGNANSDLQSVILRYFNPIGAHPSGLIGELPIGIPNNLVPYITQTAAGKREKIVVFGNDYNTHDGTCVRDYIHVCDLANAHVKALERLNDCFLQKPEIFNLGTGTGNTVMEVIKTFEEVNKVKVTFEIGKRRSGDVESIYADNSKAVKELKWSPRYTLADALQHSWKWEKNQIEKSLLNE